MFAGLRARAEHTVSLEPACYAAGQRSTTVPMPSSMTLLACLSVWTYASLPMPICMDVRVTAAPPLSAIQAHLSE
eukprot:6033203-Amphidinium_carterae.1